MPKKSDLSILRKVLLNFSQFLFFFIHNKIITMVKVGIIGHAGRVGRPLLEILSKHPYVGIVYTESKSKGRKGNLRDVELVFLALPYGESRKYLPHLKGKRIIDLSIDHRNDEGWIYGLPELNKNKIKNAQRVANPGCYATSVILGLVPLKGKIHEASIASTSGISGAGLEVKEKDNFLIYEEGRIHPQIKEIKKVLGLKEILFIPQRIDTSDRGMISVIFVNHEGAENLFLMYRKFYKSSPFIRIKKDEDIETKNVVGTNYCDIKISKFGNKIIVISALDNLIKGAAGQAVQNFNLMNGFQEKMGLLQ